MKRLFFINLAFLSVLTLTARADPTGLDLYILAGQSNMSGRAPAIDLPTFANAANIHVFKNSWVWGAAVEPIDDATDQQLSVGIDNDAEVGPGIAFADRMVSLNGRPVGLIPCPKGGSQMTEWATSYIYTSLYGACLAAARRAAPAGAIKGILFWQGESDAATATEANQWAARFTRLVKDIRQDLNNPTLPVVFAQLGKDPTTRASEFPAWNIVQEQQWLTRDDNLVMVTTDDLPVQSDELHSTTATAVEVGRRFADALFIFGTP